MDNLPQTHVIVGDMGAAYAYSLCNSCTSDESCTCTDKSKGVVSEIEEASMLLHVGDFAYDFENQDGVLGDIFMENIQPVSAYIPYMVSVGNHEDSTQSLAHYLERFNHMPSTTGQVSSPGNPTGLARNTLYFSWNDGLVHYVSISTEIQGLTMGSEMARKQFEWLKQDLIKANKKRDKQPWILVNGHRSMYCSCDGDCDSEASQQRDGPWHNGTYGFEELFFEQGVDFFINGHEHDYERMWPTYKNNTDQSNFNPKATIYVVTGSAGCKELHEPFQKWQPARSAYRSNTFGYSKLITYNHTHARWQEIVTDPTFFPMKEYGEIIDDVMVVQHNHGPFDKAFAPKHPATDKSSQVSYDHWDSVPHPRSGIVLPHGLSWRHAIDDVDNSSYAKFVDEFGSAVWEPMAGDLGPDAQPLKLVHERPKAQTPIACTSTTRGPAAGGFRLSVRLPEAECKIAAESINGIPIPDIDIKISNIDVCG